MGDALRSEQLVDRETYGDGAVVADMAVRHEVSARADLGEVVPLPAAQAEGDALADHTVFADGEARTGRVVAANLRFPAEHDLRMDDAACPDFGLATDHDMGK